MRDIYRPRSEADVYQEMDIWEVNLKRAIEDRDFVKENYARRKLKELNQEITAYNCANEEYDKVRLEEDCEEY